jgi:hypothetical protein
MTHHKGSGWFDGSRPLSSTIGKASFVGKGGDDYDGVKSLFSLFFLPQTKRIGVVRSFNKTNFVR